MTKFHYPCYSDFFFKLLILCITDKRKRTNSETENVRKWDIRGMEINSPGYCNRDKRTRVELPCVAMASLHIFSLFFSYESNENARLRITVFFAGTLFGLGLFHSFLFWFFFFFLRSHGTRTRGFCWRGSIAVPLRIHGKYVGRVKVVKMM